MTQHEQKPESAEFRTRETQLSALMGVISFHQEYPMVAELLTRHIAEAEARGAAEQRRKDTEGLEEPGAWRWRARTYNGEQYGPWMLVYNDPTPSLELNTCDIHEVEKLYPRPTNVAALEARIKELEREICTIRERVTNAASNVMGIETEAMNGDNLATTLCSYFEDMTGQTDGNGWHSDAKKACTEVEVAIVAHMTAAICEEGKHV